MGMLCRSGFIVAAPGAEVGGGAGRGCVEVQGLCPQRRKLSWAREPGRSGSSMRGGLGARWAAVFSGGPALPVGTEPFSWCRE